MNSVLTYLPRVPSRVVVYMMRLSAFRVLVNSWRNLERRYKGFNRLTFTVSFINNPFHEEDISETAQLIACVFKEIVNEPGLGIINLQTDFATQKKNEWHILSEFRAVCKVSFCKMSDIKGKYMFRFCLLERIRFLSVKTRKSKYRSWLSDMYSNDMTVRKHFLPHTILNTVRQLKRCSVKYCTLMWLNVSVLLKRIGGFSTIKVLKPKHRTSLTGKHLNDCMRVDISTYTPSYIKLAEEVQCQVQLSSGIFS